MSQKVYTFCDMNNGYSNAIKAMISEAQPGAIFIHSDFSDLADSATIRKCLSRMVTDKEIRRIKPGLYDKPKYSQLLQENLPPDPDKIAKAIARNFHWTIAPCGDQAMNILTLFIFPGIDCYWRIQVCQLPLSSNPNISCNWLN